MSTVAEYTPVLLEPPGGQITVEGISLSNLLSANIAQIAPSAAIESMRILPEIVGRANASSENRQLIDTHLARLIATACEQGNIAVADILLSAASSIGNRTQQEDLFLAELRKKVYALDSGKGLFSSSMSLSSLPRMSDFQGEVIQPREAFFDEDPHMIMKETIDPWIEKLDPNGDAVEFGGHFHAIMKLLVDRIMSYGQMSMHIEEKFGGMIHTGFHHVYAGWINEELRAEVYQRLNQVMEKFIAFDQRLEEQHVSDPKVRNSYIHTLLFSHTGGDYAEFPMMCGYVAKDEAWGIDNLKSETKAYINRMVDERLSDTDATLVADYSAKITHRAKDLVASRHRADRYFIIKREEAPRLLELEQEKQLLETTAKGSAAELVAALHSIYPLLSAGAAEAVTLGVHTENYADALLLRAQADELLQKLSGDFRTPIAINQKAPEATVSDAYTAVQMALGAFGKMSKEIGGILAIRALRSAHLIDVYRTLQIVDALGQKEAADMEKLMGLPKGTIDGRLYFDEGRKKLHQRFMELSEKGREELPDPVDVLAGKTVQDLPADVSQLKLETLFEFLKSVQGQTVFDGRMRDHALVRDVAADRLAVGMQCDSFTHMIGESALRILFESDSPLQLKRSNILPLHIFQGRESEVSGYDDNHGSVLMVLPSVVGDGYQYAFIDPNLVYGVKKGPYIVLLKQEDLTMSELCSTAVYPEIGPTAKKITFHPKNLAVFGEDGKIHETPYSSDLFIQLPREVAVYFDREWSAVSDESLVRDLFTVDIAAAHHIAPADMGTNFALLRNFSSLISEAGDGMGGDERFARQVLDTVMYEFHRRFLNHAAYLQEGIYKPERHLNELLSALPLALYLNHRYASLFLLKQIGEIRAKNKEVDVTAPIPEEISRLFDNDMRAFYDNWALELKKLGAANSNGVEMVRNEIGKTWEHLFSDSGEREQMVQLLSQAVTRLNTTEQKESAPTQGVLAARALQYLRSSEQERREKRNPEAQLGNAHRDEVKARAILMIGNQFGTEHKDTLRYDGIHGFAQMTIPAIVDLKDSEVSARMVQILRDHPQILARVASHLQDISQLLWISPWRLKEIAAQLGPSLAGQLEALELPSST